MTTLQNGPKIAADVQSIRNDHNAILAQIRSPHTIVTNCLNKVINIILDIASHNSGKAI